MAATCCEFTWIKQLLADLHISHSKAAILHCDSQVALHIAANPIFHKCTKHIEVDCHLIRNKIQEGSIVTAYVPTHSRLANIFIKALSSIVLNTLLSKMGMVNLYSPSCKGYWKMMVMIFLSIIISRCPLMKLFYRIVLDPVCMIRASWSFYNFTFS